VPEAFFPTGVGVVGYVFLLFIPIFWLLILRPQQLQRRRHMEVVAALAPGQQVMTMGGLIGTVVRVDAETVAIDAGGGTELTFGRTFVRQRVEDPAGASPAADGPQADDVPGSTGEADEIEPGGERPA
jgi:preprotein translocase subunit YajC